MASSGTWIYMLTTMLFFGFLAYLNTILPVQYQVLNTFDFLWFGGNVVAVAGACVIATGLPCAAALAVFGIGSFFAYIVVSYEWLKLILFLPIVVTMIYVLSQLARGTD